MQLLVGPHVGYYQIFDKFFGVNLIIQRTLNKVKVCLSPETQSAPNHDVHRIIRTQCNKLLQVLGGGLNSLYPNTFILVVGFESQLKNFFVRKEYTPQKNPHPPFPTSVPTACEH
eukprot:c12842_g3_i2.p2 GENE.c12842_g3_i2~~c12842_g3_i2.p2  ORF type:complete len:115 (+),score=5.14 c12842_g3_i2:855-1199(+)